jgi:hypothetical protein
MKKGDIVGFISERKIVHARIYDWNGNLQSHVKLVDGRRNTYKSFPWELYEADQFTRDGRILMTAEDARIAAAETRFLDSKHERETFRKTFVARPTSIRHADGRTTFPGRHVDYAQVMEKPSVSGKLERFDLPTEMVQQGMGYDEDDKGNATRYVCKTGMTMHHQLEDYLVWVTEWEPKEQRALELLTVRSPKQAEVWKRCIKGNWHGLTESQVAVARGWGITPQAIHNLKRKADAFMTGYLGIDPRRFYASYDPGKAA